MNNAAKAEKIKMTCKSKNVSAKKLLEDCGISRNFIYDLEKRDSAPSVDAFEKIADYLDCSVDYLLGRTDKPEINK